MVYALCWSFKLNWVIWIIILEHVFPVLLDSFGIASCSNMNIQFARQLSSLPLNSGSVNKEDNIQTCWQTFISSLSHYANFIFAIWNKENEKKMLCWRSTAGRTSRAGWTNDALERWWTNNEFVVSPQSIYECSDLTNNRPFHSKLICLLRNKVKQKPQRSPSEYIFLYSLVGGKVTYINIKTILQCAAFYLF